MFQQLGIWDGVVAAASKFDPNAALMKLGRSIEPRANTDETNAVTLIAGLCVLAVNLSAISFYFSMPELLEQARKGDDLALLKAVRIDPAVPQCDVAADRIATASFLDDRGFPRALSQAITKAKPSLGKPHLDEMTMLESLGP